MSASHTAAPAYCASWADAMPVLHHQAPDIAAVFLGLLTSSAQPPDHVQAARHARKDIRAHGWEPPTWDQLARAEGPPRHPTEALDGPQQPGWQQHATAPFHTAARTDLYSTLDPASQALLDSQSGPFASRAFTTIPYTSEATYPPHSPCLIAPVGAVALLTHLATTVQLAPGQGYSEAEGCHWNTQQHEFAGKLAPVRGGRFAAAALHTARRNKERTYPELAASGRCRLVVLAMEVGGRCSTEAAQFLRLLAQAKARDVPRPLRQSTIMALIARWSAILTHAAMQAFASSLQLSSPDGITNGEGALPPLGHLLAHRLEPTADSTGP
eukprot:s556_g1.t1